jgi:hypothetical protein
VRVVEVQVMERVVKVKMEPSSNEQDCDEAMQPVYGEERDFEDFEGDLWADADEEIVV